VPEARNPIDGRPPGEVALDKARRKASGVGLLAMKNELSEMTGAPLAVQFKQDIKPGPGVGSGIGAGVGAGTETGVPVRALITSNATRGSGGINTAAYSRDTGGGGLAGRSTTLVEGVAGGGGGGGPGGGGSRAGGGTGGDGTGRGGTLAKGGSGKASRSIEEIKLVFERNKGAIYALYNRALRDEPALQGKVVLELKIAPGGQVSDLRIVSSELKADELERKLLARIRQFDFGAKDVDLMVVTWPVDFLPS
jgi:TonB family protein